MPLKFGLQLWSQQTDWPGFRDAALAAEAHGWDSVWTWDHLLAIFGPWEQPIFEGWSALAALGPITSRVRLGLMVGANTFRNPGLTAKLATTLDHVSGGRAVLGIGGAWFEREHEAFGIDVRGEPGRAARLARRVGRCSCAGCSTASASTTTGRRYTFARRALRAATRPGAPADPHRRVGPAQKTLRTVAERADAWNTSGPLEEVRDALDDARSGTAADVGRDLATIEKTVSFPIVLRDDARGRRGRGWTS